MRFEQDEVTLLGGVRHGRTLGSPVAIEIGNTEWTQPTSGTRRCRRAPGATAEAAHPAPARATPTWPACRSTASTTPATCSSGPRPARPRRGSPPARWPRRCCAELGVEVLSPRRSRSGRCASKAPTGPTPADLERVDESPVRCFDPAAEAAMIDEIKAAAKDGDSLGGVVEVLGLRRARRARQPRALGPQARRAAGPGAHEHPGRQGRRDRRRLRGRRAPGLARPTTRSSGTPTPAATAASRTLAGGIEGGMSTGELLVGPRRHEAARHAQPARC